MPLPNRFLLPFLLALRVAIFILSPCRALLSPCHLCHPAVQATDGMGPAVQGPPGVPKGHSALRLSPVPHAMGREAGRGEASGERPGHQVQGKLDSGPRRPAEPA